MEDKKDFYRKKIQRLTDWIKEECKKKPENREPCGITGVEVKNRYGANDQQLKVAAQIIRYCYTDVFVIKTMRGYTFTTQELKDRQRQYIKDFVSGRL